MNADFLIALVIAAIGAYIANRFIPQPIGLVIAILIGIVFLIAYVFPLLRF